MKKEQFIPVDRKKMILMTVLYAVLGIGAFLVTYYLGENQDWVSPGIFKFLSVVVLLFFIIVAGSFAKNVKQKTAGLTINYSGLDDQSNSISIGEVKWKDVTGIAKVSTPSAKYILLTVKKPQKFIDNAKNGAIKRLLNQNMTLYKTPVVINASILQISLEELEAELIKYKTGDK